MALKMGGRIGLGIVLVGAIYLGGKWWSGRPKEVEKSAEIGKVSVPTTKSSEASLVGTAAVKLDFPTIEPAMNGGTQFTISEMAWQSQTSINYANGGDRTTKGSLFDKQHLDITIVRTDDCAQTVADFAKNAASYAANGTKEGYIAIFMGSGAPNYLHQMSVAVKNLPTEYQPVIIGTTGKSFGEDQIIGDIKYKNNPQLLRGAVLRGVMLDGDIDLALKFCGDNGIPVNVNEFTYDPNALNLSYSKTFLAAVVEYNNPEARETRKLIVNGKTGKDTSVGYDLVATWTPGDVNAVQKGRGGATIISTKIYSSVMPNVLIVNKKFLNDHRTDLENFFMAVSQAGDQVRTFDDVKKFACKINGKIYAEDLDWYKLYNGFNQGDAHLGGSMVFNMADIAGQFGLSGSSDIYREVYNTFAKLQTSLYKKDFPAYIEYNKAVDKSLLLSIVANHPELLEGKPLKTEYAEQITEKVASKNVSINFRTGSSEIDPSSYGVLDQVYSSAVTADGLKVGIYGHTDNTGNPDANRVLSAARAESVKQYLINKKLPEERLETRGYGDTQPIASNATASGKAQNRRVEIVLGN